MCSTSAHRIVDRRRFAGLRQNRMVQSSGKDAITLIHRGAKTGRRAVELVTDFELWKLAGKNEGDRWPETRALADHFLRIFRFAPAAELVAQCVIIFPDDCHPVIEV